MLQELWLSGKIKIKMLEELLMGHLEYESIGGLTIEAWFIDHVFSGCLLIY